MRDLRREELLAPAWLRIENPSTWEHPGFGMALFLAPDYVLEYHLPLAFSPLVAVGDRFLLKPLLPAFLEDEAFFVLALSQHDVHLYYGAASSLLEVDLGETPRSLADALRYDTRTRR